MTLKEVAQIVTAIGFPCVYSHFTQLPDETPYVVYYYPSENDVKADNKNYLNRRQLFIELYTSEKDFESEAEVEAVLTSNGFTWYKQTDFLNDEKLFQTTYEMEVIINGE